MSWTAEQQAAMQKTDTNLLVAAGAGSGKTAVLIERVLGMITDEQQPVDVDDLLIVTFTAAAAAEMRERLTKALRDRLQDDPENAVTARQLVLLQRANITTIHSFCLQILKEHGYLLGLDAKSRIGSDGELALLQENVLDEVFEAAYADDNSGLRQLLRTYSRGIGDDNLRELVLRLLRFAQSMPDIEGWLGGLAAVYTNGDAGQWLAYFTECLQEDIKQVAELAAEAARAADAVPKYQPVIEAEAAELAAVLAMAEEAPAQQVLAALANISFKSLPRVTAKDDIDPADKERVQALRNRVKGDVAQILSNGRPVLTGRLDEELAELAPLAKALVDLALAYYRAWQAAKQKAHLWEFADLEHYALDLLQNDELGVAEGFKNRFYEVLVDEYQDVNRVQETLLQALSRDNNRFMVGDIKQSIYRFRLAEPGLFLEKFAAYGRGEGGRRIDLNRNFRSLPGVLDGINYVFSRIMQGGNAEITYDEAAMLYPGRTDDQNYPCELLIIDKAAIKGQQAGDDEAAPVAEMQDAKLEGRLLAERIWAEHKAGRKWGDMVVLLRAVKVAVPVICRELAAKGIPCVTDIADDFINLPEVQTVVNLLTVIDNPRQDIPLAALLHSPVVGLALADLADLRTLSGENAPLYDGLRRTHKPELLKFLQRLDEWRQKSRELGVGELLTYIYNQTALPEVMSALPGGELRRKNLDEIKRYAAEYDAGGSLGITRFLRFLQAAGRKQAADKQPNIDAVRLMSVHKSKGLQFPVVFVAGMGGKFNESDFNQDILLHRTLGLGMRRVDLAGKLKYPTFGFNVIKRKAAWENIAEALRILYVAMTRAQDKLVLVGVANMPKLAAKISTVSTQDAVQPAFLAAEKAFLPIVAAALLPHPDAGILRQAANRPQVSNTDIAGYSGHWQIEIIDWVPGQGEAAADEVFSFADWLAADSAADTADIAAVLQRDYPAAALQKLPVKWSATSLERLEPLYEPDEQTDPANNTDAASAAVEFAEDMQAGGYDADYYAALGSLIHAILEKADLGAIANGADPTAELTACWRRLSAGYAPDVAAAVRVERLARLFAVPLGRRLLAAVKGGGTVLREQRFTARLTVAQLKQLNLGAWAKLGAATGLNLREYADEELFFQGVIDLAFYDPELNGWLLVDYKSGGNRSLSDADVAAKYGWQLALYKYALAAATNRTVQGGCIFFTANARTVKVF